MPNAALSENRTRGSAKENGFNSKRLQEEKVMLKYIRIFILSILSFIAGVYIPVLVIAVVAGETNTETILPYLLLSGAVFLIFYLWLERKNITSR